MPTMYQSNRDTYIHSAQLLDQIAVFVNYNGVYADTISIPYIASSATSMKEHTVQHQCEDSTKSLETLVVSQLASYNNYFVVIR